MKAFYHSTMGPNWVIHAIYGGYQYCLVYGQYSHCLTVERRVQTPPRGVPNSFERIGIMVHEYNEQEWNQLAQDLTPILTEVTL